MPCVGTWAPVCPSTSLSSARAARSSRRHWGNGWLKTNSAGSGPFILKSWKPDETLVLEANPDYHHPFLVAREPKAIGIIVVSTDRGLAGALNANVFRQTLHLMREWESKGATVGLCLIGTAKEKASVLSFVLEGYRPEDVGSALNREGIAVRSGHHCAQPILRRFGHEATVRPSLAFYNTCEEVDVMVAALHRLARANRK